MEISDVIVSLKLKRVNNKIYLAKIYWLGLAEKNTLNFI